MKSLSLLCLACSTSFALGQVWNEVGDAGELIGTAQITMGNGALTNIIGTIGATTDRDVYCIRINNPAAFSATTVGQPGSLTDTQLFLFDGNGMGVTHNDDTPAGGSLRSLITNQFLTSPGIYYLAISGYNGDPVNPGGLLIWNNTPFAAERAPDGPGAPGPLSAWAGTSATGTYDILLTGAAFCHAPGAEVAGRIVLDDYIPDEAGRTVTMEVMQGGMIVDTQTVVLGTGGLYSFTTNQTGPCEILAKASHWLRRKSATVTLVPGGTTAVSLALANGDVNDDNEVDIGDYAQLSNAFGSVPGDSNWNPEADLNGDLEVDIGDYAILSSNFGMVGD